jgi:hypothetical protein
LTIAPADLPRLLGAVIDEVHAVLSAHGVAHALIGGLAVGIHAAARATKDVDLAVVATAESAERVIADRRARGYEPRTHGRPGPGAVVRFARTGEDGIVRWVDLLFAGTPFEERAVGRAAPREVLGRPIDVVSVEDLIVYKLLAGRPQDVADLVVLLREHGARIDRVYLADVTTSREPARSAAHRPARRCAPFWRKRIAPQ